MWMSCAVLCTALSTLGCKVSTDCEQPALKTVDGEGQTLKILEKWPRFEFFRRKSRETARAAGFAGARGIGRADGAHDRGLDKVEVVAQPRLAVVGIEDFHRM